MKEMEYRAKPWEELTLADHFIFQKFMMNDEMCKQVLSEIIGKEVVKLEHFRYEKSIQMRCDSKGIRLDVYVKGEDEVYNIEIQNSEECNIPKRSRFYQSMMDLDLLEKGELYDKLCHSYVIFICTFDYFGLNQYRYTFTYQCDEVDGLEFGDMTTHIILNTRGCEGEVSEKLKIFLKCINDVFSDDSFSARIKKEVERIKFSEEWRAEYMYYELKLKEQEEIGVKRGIEIGEKRGIEIGEKRGIEIGEKRGIEMGQKRGIEMGENKLAALMSILSKEGKIDEVRRVATDEEYREKLYLEYGIGNEE